MQRFLIRFGELLWLDSLKVPSPTTSSLSSKSEDGHVREAALTFWSAIIKSLQRMWPAIFNHNNACSVKYQFLACIVFLLPRPFLFIGSHVVYDTVGAANPSSSHGR